MNLKPDETKKSRKAKRDAIHLIETLLGGLPLVGDGAESGAEDDGEAGEIHRNRGNPEHHGFPADRRRRGRVAGAGLGSRMRWLGFRGGGGRCDERERWGMARRSRYSRASRWAIGRVFKPRVTAWLSEPVRTGFQGSSPRLITFLKILSAGPTESDGHDGINRASQWYKNGHGYWRGYEHGRLAEPRVRAWVLRGPYHWFLPHDEARFWAPENLPAGHHRRDPPVSPYFYRW